MAKANFSGLERIEKRKRDRAKRAADYAPGGRYGNNFINRLFPGINNRNRAIGIPKDKPKDLGSKPQRRDTTDYIAMNQRVARLQSPKDKVFPMSTLLNTKNVDRKKQRVIKKSSKVVPTVNIDRLFLQGSLEGGRKQTSVDMYVRNPLTGKKMMGLTSSYKGKDGKASTTKYLKQYDKGKERLDKMYRKQMKRLYITNPFVIDKRKRKANLKGGRGRDPNIFNPGTY